MFLIKEHIWILSAINKRCGKILAYMTTQKIISAYPHRGYLDRHT